jgi:RNA ligase
MFPTINHINDLLPYIETNSQFRVQVQPNGTTVACYMLQDEDTFRGEHDAWYKECRGITFDVAGRVASRTLHKFQNIGENEGTQPDMIPWDRIVRVMDKRDGSMITPVLVGDSVVCKTKKTFTSAEAVAATEFLHRVDDGQYGLEWVKTVLRAGWTPIFEWTSPRFPIVLLYERDELTLLHIRNNVTGEYLLDLESLFETRCPFPIVENLYSRGVDDDPRALLDLALTKEGIEGWIIQADDGQMWKIKTQWYVKLHHAVTFTRWRDIARTVLDDKSDDLKAAFALTGRAIQPILEVEFKIGQRIKFAREASRQIVDVFKSTGADAKTVALSLKDHEHFGVIMQTWRGREVDWFAWYTKNHLKSDWGLEVVGTVTEDQEVPEVQE